MFYDFIRHHLYHTQLVHHPEIEQEEKYCIIFYILIFFY